MFTDYSRIQLILNHENDLYNFLSNGALKSEARENSSYRTNYIGSKQKLLDWIWVQTPDNVETVVDAFSGSSAVGYMYKQKGLSVISNDRLKYCFHIAKAIIENNDVILAEAETEDLLKPNTKADNFVQKTFKDVFFTKDILPIIDYIRSNIESLSGYKKDIALFALGHSCIAAAGTFGYFGTKSNYTREADTKEKFEKRFLKQVKKINNLVFDNTQECKAHNKDINELLPKLKADAAYFDPPYSTPFSHINYEKSYHFIEGLMTNWKNKEIDQDKLTKMYKIDYKSINKTNASQFITDFLTSAKHIPHWILSYRDKSYPDEKEIKKIIASFGKKSRMKSRDHIYLRNNSIRSESSYPKEHIFVCMPEDIATASNSKLSIISTKITGKVITDSLTTNAAKKQDKRFKFVLTHAGTNRNGDHFTVEELQQAATSAITKKIDLQHSQEFTDIVGGIEDAWFVEDGASSRVEGTGELFTEDSESSRLAYKLLKKGIVSHVSMECDYTEGECSICGKKVKSKAEYCTHLKNYKGRSFKGKPVYEILHGITFTGLGLLDREGADTGAQIKEVANYTDPSKRINNSGNSDNQDNSTDPDKLTNSDNLPNPKKKGDAKMADKDKTGKDDTTNSSDTGNNEKKDEIINKQKNQLEQQAKQLEEMKKEVDAFKAEKEAEKRRAKAEKVLQEWEKRGRKFKTDEEREKELSRLSSMSDDALNATEDTILAFELNTDNEKPNTEGDTAENKQNSEEVNNKKQESKASKEYQENPKADAGVKPKNVNDETESLQQKLTNAIMYAYNSRESNR